MIYTYFKTLSHLRRVKILKPHPSILLGFIYRESNICELLAFLILDLIWFCKIIGHLINYPYLIYHLSNVWSDLLTVYEV